MSDPCLFVAGLNATRRDVIKFVANKLGGVHLDHQRNPSKFREYNALDEARRTFQVADLDAVYHELSSIGQQLVGAPNVLELLEAGGLEGPPR